MQGRAVFALVIAVSVMVAACSPEPSASPTPQGTQVAGGTATPGAASPTPDVTASPDPTPASTSSPWPISTILTSWSRVDLPERVDGVYGGNLPNDMVWFNDRFVAVGGVNAGCCDGGFSTNAQALVWRSRDGLTWNLVPDSESFDLGHMHAVAANDARVVAVGARMLESTTGEARRVGATWSSTDGRTWRMVWGSVPLLVDVVATDDGFFAATERGDRPAPAIWHSADGLTWTRAAAPGELGDGVINRLITTPAGFLAVGASINTWADPGSTEVPRAAVWSSIDGLAWTRAADQPAFADGTIVDVAALDGRYVAIGHDNEFASVRIWLSDDAETWQRLDAAVFQSAGFLDARVFALSAGFVVVGGELQDTTSGIVARTTPDGTSWSVVPEQASLEGSDVTVAGIIEIDSGGATAVGSYWGSDGMTPAAWTIR